MNIMLVDDEDLSREAVSDFISEQLGHKVVEFKNGKEAYEAWLKNDYPVIISDIRMPQMTGVSLLEAIKDHPKGKNVDIVLITGYADVDTAVRALRAGAYDYMQKPVNIEELASILEKIEEHQSLLSENKLLKEEFNETLDNATGDIRKKLSFYQSAYANIVGIGNVGIFSLTMKSIMDICQKLHSDRSLPVLIEGSTGTGKEIIARKIHYGNGENSMPFITINCAAITPSLFESELFGYDEGAFTGAKRSGSIGKMELAQGGTLFLDEIGEMPLDLQPKLLRAIQQQEIYRVGGNRKIKLDVRFICATNRNLLELSHDGRFRLDLYYRLNVAKIMVPPLRERKDEILPLAQMFLLEFAESKKKRFRMIHPEALKILEQHEWLGNVRELQNTIERIVLLYDDIELKPQYLKFLDNDQYFPIDGGFVLESGKIELPDHPINLEAINQEIVIKALKKFNDNKSKTAEYLGISRSALRSRM